MSKIGIFDSGLGGLTVLNAIRKELPEYDYLYLGDSARAPYGSKTKKEIYLHTEQAVAYLFQNDCALIILACNTVSAEALRRIQQEYLPIHFPDRRVLGVIVPTAEELGESRSIERIGIIATERTVSSGAYPRETSKIDSRKEVFQKAAPRLVPLIESGIISGPQLEQLITDYIEPLRKKGIQALILGCTHYAIIEDAFLKIAPELRIVNQSHIVAKSLKNYLARHQDIERKIGKNQIVKYLCTGDPLIFKNLVKKMFDTNISIEKIRLEERG